MSKKSIVVTNIDAAKLVQAAMRFDSKIVLVDDENKVNINAKSLMGVMVLATKVKQDGIRLEINADGSDAEEALTAIEQYLTK